MLTVNNLSKIYQVESEQITALRSINFMVKGGEFYSLVGPSGCGKSTLLRIIAGLIPKSSGEISWETPPTLGFVFQNFALFPYLTIYENIAFGLNMHHRDARETKRIVDELIEEVGLSGFGDKHPKEISGGMKQRVGIARALAVSPNVLLLDEPFSSLDEFTAETLRKLLLSLWHKRKITVIMVTHLIEEAIELSDRIAVMTPGPGTIEEVVEDSLPRPRNLRSKEFFSLEDKILSLVKS